MSTTKILLILGRYLIKKTEEGEQEVNVFGSSYIHNKINSSYYIAREACTKSQVYSIAYSTTNQTWRRSMANCICIPTKTIRSYHNDKPCSNTYIKHKLQAKQDAYKDNDKDKKARYAAEKAVKTGKAKYRDKLEENLTANNSKNIWQGLKAITNYKPSPKNTTATDANPPDRLNDFYSRFNKLNTTSPSSITPFSSLPPFTVDENVVRSMFQRLNSRKAADPDNISPCLLKLCANQLSSVFTDIFNVSLSQCKTPHCFKKSTIIPVPNKSTASCLNEYRPVALTTVVMKTLGPAVSEINCRSIA